MYPYLLLCGVATTQVLQNFHQYFSRQGSKKTILVMTRHEHDAQTKRKRSDNSESVCSS